MNRRKHLRIVSSIFGVVCLCAATSCTEQIMLPPVAPKTERSPFTPVAALELELRSHRGPMLVEFAQDFNCARCDQMVSTMDDLRSVFSRDVAFHRVNYLSAANQYQLGICPSYMLVLDGQVVDRLAGKQPYPILASRLNVLITAHRKTVGNPTNLSDQEKENDGDRNY